METKQNPRIKPLVIKTVQGDAFYDYDDIIRFEADGNQTKVFSKNGVSFTTPSNLANLEKRLPSHTFFRCHRSHIINLAFVCCVSRKSRRITLMNTQVPISTEYLEKFYQLIDVNMGK